MISLSKIEAPQILLDKAEEWSKELMDYVSKDEKIPNSVQGRYSHKSIKEALLNETSKKCAYCESKILHIGYGDIEHILPKKKFPEKTFEWTNLTLACGKCNQNKSHYYDESLMLLNPYVDYVEEEIFFIGPLPRSNFNNESRGELTIKKLKLDRVELIEKRTEYLDKIDYLIRRYVNEENSPLKKLFYEDILKLTNKDNEFSSMVKYYLKHYNIIEPQQI
jgi:uncharacterized protein (TIGR02646 family)